MIKRTASSSTDSPEMDFGYFDETLGNTAPPNDLIPPLTALWHAAKGEWKRAHEIVQAEDDATAAWVHAYLHRVEGDEGNAAYWYRRAGKPHAQDTVESEWRDIVGALLADTDNLKHRHAR